MNEKTIQVPAILTSISHTKDGGLRLGFTTQEIPPAEKLLISQFFQSFGYLLFKENQFQETDIPKEEAEEGQKSPSKRQRAVLFIKWKQESKEPDFEIYYRRQIEKYIDLVKSKLDD